MKKVLLVEDDPFIRDITSIKLSEHGHSALTAVNGSEALTLIEKEVPDAVLLDLDLPDMSGLEVIKKMKQDAKHALIPIVIFSNNDNPAILQEAQKLGVAGFFVKATTNFDDLYAKLIAIIGE